METTMSKPRHTPGPWSGGCEAINDSEGRLLATVRYCSNPTPENPIAVDEGHANSRLIAATPELVRALKDLLAWCERYAPPESHHYELTGARAAIAKAEGR